MKKILFILFIICLINLAKANNNEIFLNIYENNYFNYHKNLLNSDYETGLLKKIINVYRRNSTLISDNKSEDNIDTSSFDNYSQKAFILYLKSILFISKDNWSIWLNDKKITNENNKISNEFYIKDIYENKIILQWNVSQFKWGYVNKMNNISKDKYKVLENGRIELILTLHPNQSYLPFDDKVIEGKYQEIDIIKKEEILNNINNNDADLDLESIINSL